MAIFGSEKDAGLKPQRGIRGQPEPAPAGGFFFGANWALFMTFVPMVFSDALLDAALRVGLDILLATGAGLLVGRSPGGKCALS